MVKEKGAPSRSQRIRRKIEARKPSVRGVSIKNPKALAEDLMFMIHETPRIELSDPPVFYVEHVPHDNPFKDTYQIGNKKFLTLVKGRIVTQKKINVDELKTIMREIGKEIVEHDHRVTLYDPEWPNPEAEKDYKEFCESLNNPKLESELNGLILKHKA